MTPQAISFHLDENVDPAVAHGLRRRGIDVTFASEVGLLGATDEEHLAFAHAAGRVLVTHDDDYLALHRQGASHAGIAYCHPAALRIGGVLRGLLLIWGVMTAEEMRDHVEFL